MLVKKIKYLGMQKLLVLCFVLGFGQFVSGGRIENQPLGCVKKPLVTIYKPAKEALSGRMFTIKLADEGSSFPIPEEYALLSETFFKKVISATETPVLSVPANQAAGFRILLPYVKYVYGMRTQDITVETYATSLYSLLITLDLDELRILKQSADYLQIPEIIDAGLDAVQWKLETMKRFENCPLPVLSGNKVKIAIEDKDKNLIEIPREYATLSQLLSTQIGMKNNDDEVLWLPAKIGNELDVKKSFSVLYNYLPMLLMQKHEILKFSVGELTRTELTNLVTLADYLDIQKIVDTGVGEVAQRLRNDPLLIEKGWLESEELQEEIFKRYRLTDCILERVEKQLEELQRYPFMYMTK